MSPAKRKQTDPLEKAIEAALSPGRFISYNAAWSFVEDVQGVADDIGKIIQKEPARGARLYETFIAACHEKADEIDDSSGSFGMLVEDRLSRLFWNVQKHVGQENRRGAESGFEEQVQEKKFIMGQGR